MPISANKNTPKSKISVPKNVDVDNLIDITECSKMLKTSKHYIYQLTSKKKIPHYKLADRKILFDKTEIKNWVKSKKVDVI